MRISLLVITDGRQECLSQTLAAFELAVDSSLIERRIVVDDSTDPNYGAWIADNFAFDEHLWSPEKRGFAGAIAAGWDRLQDAEYIFHLEDDFVLARHIPLGAMMEVLAERPYLAQMALRRQPWGPEEVLAGGYVAANPHLFHDVVDPRWPDRRWMEQRLFFTTNPSIYPVHIARRGWPIVPRSEDAFSLSLFEVPQTACGIWGQRSEAPWVIHIGAQRVGVGY